MIHFHSPFQNTFLSPGQRNLSFHMFPARCSIPKPMGKQSLKTSSCSPATPSSEAINTTPFVNGTFAPCSCTKVFLAELRNRGWLLSHSGWRLRPFSHPFWKLFSQAALVYELIFIWHAEPDSITLQERILFAIQCIRDHGNCRAGWPLAYNSAAISPVLLLW